MGIPRSYRRSTQPNLRDLCRSDRSSASSYKNVHCRKNVRAGRQSAFTSPSSDSSGRLWVRLRALCASNSRDTEIFVGMDLAIPTRRAGRKLAEDVTAPAVQLELSFRQMEITGSLCHLVSLLGCSRHRAPPLAWLSHHARKLHSTPRKIARAVLALHSRRQLERSPAFR